MLGRLAGEAAGPNLAAGLGLLSTLVMLAGLTGLPPAPVVAASLVLFGAAGGPFRASRPEPAAFLGALPLALAALATLAPDLSWDSLAYHSAVPKLFLQAGRVFPTPTIFGANLPNLCDMSVLLGMTVGGMRAAAIPTFLFAVSLWRSTALLARRRLSAPLAETVAAAVLFLPALVVESGTAASEIGWSAFAVAALALVPADRDGEGDSGFRRRLLAAGACAGFAAAAKATGAVSLAAAAAALIASCSRGWRASALFAAAAAAAAAPTFARIFAFTGTPFFPFRIGPFAPRFFDDAALARNALLQRTIWGPAAAGPDALAEALVRSVAEGQLELLLPIAALSVAALLAWRRTGSSPLLPAALFCAVHLPIFLAVTAQPRFLLPAAPVALVLLVVALRPLPAGAFLAALPLIGVFAIGGSAWRARTAEALAGLRDPESAADRPSAAGAGALLRTSRLVNVSTGPEARILLLRENRGFFLEPDYLWGDPVQQALVDYGRMANGADLGRRLAELSVTHVLLGPYGFGDAGFDPHTAEIAFDLLASRRLVFRRERYSLYDLRAPANSPTPPLAVASSARPLFSADAAVDGTSRPWESRLEPSPDSPAWLLLLAPPTAPITEFVLRGDPGGRFSVESDGAPVPILASPGADGLSATLPGPALRLKLKFAGPGRPRIEELIVR